MSTAAPPQVGAAAKKPRKAGLTERGRAERKLAWMLCAPAVVMMLLVTAYPIGYALWLSLQKKDLRFPDEDYDQLRDFVEQAVKREGLLRAPPHRPRPAPRRRSRPRWGSPSARGPSASSRGCCARRP